MYSKDNAPWICRAFGHTMRIKRHKLNRRLRIERFCSRCGFVYPQRLISIFQRKPVIPTKQGEGELAKLLGLKDNAEKGRIKCSAENS